MDEARALAQVARALSSAGDDAAVIEDLAITTDMLHASADFPAGTGSRTAGWRSVGASLSDLAAMGADPICAVAAYAPTEFRAESLAGFLQGAADVCEAVDTRYVGGDLDIHSELTVATTAVGRVETPVYRSGATVGDSVCVTGTLGRSAAAFELFATGEHATANSLYRFLPRVGAGRRVAEAATSMMDSSDGLARSLHQLGSASDVGFQIESDRIPIDESVATVAADEEERLAMATTFGEDFELVATVPPGAVATLADRVDCQFSVVGEVRPSADGIRIDEEPLPNRGWTHGG